MKLSLIPQIRLTQYENVTASSLRDRGITFLLCDLDFTLAPKSQKEPDESLLNWIQQLQDEDIIVMILSNNRSSKRVDLFCSSLGITYVGHAGKPGTKGIRQAQQLKEKQNQETAIMGDKLLTDMLAGNLAGITTIMVEPRGGAITLWQKVLHALQAPFKALAKEKVL